MATVNRTEYAVLGFLALGARTGYDIKKMADAALGHFWNESFGHIYPVLRRLDKKGWLTSSVEPQEGRPDRKVYALTPAGEDALAEWYRLPIDPSPPRDELLLKLFFGPLAPPHDLLTQLTAYRAAHQDALDALDALAEETAAEEAHNPSLTFWLLTVSHRRATLQAQLAWCDDALARLEAANAETV